MKRLLIIGVCALLLLGCGGPDDEDDPRAPDETSAQEDAAPATSVTSEPSSSTGVEGGQITDARVVAEFYAQTAVAWGEQGFDLQSMAEGTASTYPGLSLSGSAIPADPRTVSATATFLDDKDTPSSDNPGIVAFAVRDSSDVCIGTVAVGHPAPTEVLHFEGETGDDCTADEMVEAARAQLG